MAVPYGLGWKGNLGSGMTFQCEWGARKTWTDYLDDVSTVYMNPSRLREARGQIAVQFADRSLDNLPAELEDFSEAILVATTGTATFCSLWVFA